MATIINYPVSTKNLLKQAERDDVDFVVKYMKKAISLETPDAVIIGVKGTLNDVQVHLDANPHKFSYFIYVRNR